MSIIACGVFDKKYIYFILYSLLSIILLIICLTIAYNKYNDNNQFEYMNNILLMLLIINCGQIFFFIPELIIKKNLNDKKEKTKKENFICKCKKEKKKIAIEYIFNDLSAKITNKDIILIIISSILLLIADYIKVLIQIRNKEQINQLVLNEQYNFMILLLLVILSYLFYKNKCYRHQICSVIIIIILGIFRYILKLIGYYKKYNKYPNLFLDLFLQNIVAIIESIIIIYTKGLMELKFFSPYKICYINGVINTIIILILLIIFTFIKSEGSNWFFSLKYKEKYYLDNIYSIIDNYGYKLIFLFLSSIFYGCLKLALNCVINSFTVCHTFFLLQNKELATILFKEEELNNLTIMILISYFIEYFVILVFLEIIELKFCDLDKNTRRNIKERGEDETNKSIENLVNKKSEERNDSVGTFSEDE